MEAWQERMQTERNELSGRLVALGKFIDHNDMFAALDKEGQILLMRQEAAMTSYLSILDQRIARWK